MQDYYCDAQDKRTSDSMEPAMDLMQLNGIIRKAINLVTGAQIRVDESMFELAVTSIIPGFKVNSHCYVFRKADLQTELCSPAAALSCMLISLKLLLTCSISEVSCACRSRSDIR